jgi:prolyl oligopeptidase
MASAKGKRSTRLQELQGRSKVLPHSNRSTLLLAFFTNFFALHPIMLCKAVAVHQELQPFAQQTCNYFNFMQKFVPYQSYKNMKNYLFQLLTMLILASACQQAQRPDQAMKITYPVTKKVDQTDDYHGTLVSDPYRWLEIDTAAEVEAWVKAQNEVTFGYLANIPFREKIKQRYTEIYNYPKYSAPFRLGEYYFFDKNDGLQNQSVTYFQKGRESEPEVFLDPNSFSKDGTVTANISGYSNDKKYVNIRLAKAGSDWSEMTIMEVATKKQLTDTLRWLKFSGASWYKNGFFYSRYDAPEKGMELSAKNEYMKVYYHQLGDDQVNDKLVFEDKNAPLRYYFTQTTEDERFLILYISEGTDGTEVRYRDLSKNAPTFNVLFKGFAHNYSVIDNIGGQLLVYHNQGAPNYKISLVDPTNPAAMKDFVPEQTEKLESASTGGGKLFVSYLKDVTSKIVQYDLATGKADREIALPALGTAYGFSGDKEDKTLFYSFTSFTYPTTIFEYDLATGTSSVFRKSEVAFNMDDYETKQVFFTSKDGTRVPMFIVHKKGLQPDGTNPTLLYAYGGFNISLTPMFSTSNIILLENGGVYALANIRGGGEYGESWHKGGMLENKQNVFDDFIGAAEYLIAQGYTSPERLAISGGSNGGLLVGACMVQRPDLFKVAFPAVGVLDMLRFHLFTVGWGWVVEYGSSANPDQFPFLYAYSPLHNLKPGTAYPATMVTTADHDDRVVPAHSFKFAAALQEAHQGENPVLIRIETSAGHGAGKPTSKIIEEQADKWAFMFYNMGFTPYQQVQ